MRINRDFVQNFVHEFFVISNPGIPYRIFAQNFPRKVKLLDMVNHVFIKPIYKRNGTSTAGHYQGGEMVLEMMKKYPNIKLEPQTGTPTHTVGRNQRIKVLDLSLSRESFQVRGFSISFMFLLK